MLNQDKIKHKKILGNADTNNIIFKGVSGQKIDYWKINLNKEEVK